MLELANVDGFYGRSRALQSVSLSVGAGDFRTSVTLMTCQPAPRNAA